MFTLDLVVAIFIHFSVLFFQIHFYTVLYNIFYVYIMSLKTLQHALLLLCSHFSVSNAKAKPLNLIQF